MEDPLLAFLAEIKMEKHAQVMRDEGWDDPSFFAKMPEQQLQVLHDVLKDAKVPPGHCLRIKKHAETMAARNAAGDAGQSSEAAPIPYIAPAPPMPSAPVPSAPVPSAPVTVPKFVRLIAGKLDDREALKILAPQLDCIVNSANNGLITPGVTGIAGAIRALGGRDVQSESDQAKASHRGDVPVGEAVWTTAGDLRCRCGIAHAVTVRYNHDQREPTTPEKVGAAFKAALKLADDHLASRVAGYVMCARPGYSVLSERDAPTAMLEAMLQAAWAQGAPKLASQGSSFEIYLFVPVEPDGVPRLLLQGLPPQPHRLVWWCDMKDDGITSAALRQAGIEVVMWEDVANDTIVDEIRETVEKGQGSPPWALVTGRDRPGTEGGKDQANKGLALISSLAKYVEGPKIVCCVAEPDAQDRVSGWVHGANWVTHDLAGVKKLLLSSVSA